MKGRRERLIHRPTLPLLSNLPERKTRSNTAYFGGEPTFSIQVDRSA
jgi:hypothetical protein